MANIKDCPGFETFGADVKEARKVKQLSRKTLAEQVNIDWRYLANIENDGTIPSLPVIIQLIKICGLPVERYYDHNKDYPFAAFITNLGKYNEGELVGEWVKFPTTAEELKEVFKRIGIGQKDDFGQPYEE